MSKPVLLDRLSLQGALACTTDEESRYVLNAINVTSTYVESSDGNAAIRIPHAGADPAEFPEIPGAPIEAPEGAFLLPAALAKAALKTLPKRAVVPILQFAKVGTLNGSVVAATTDLATNSTPSARIPEGTFPPLDRAIPKERVPAFALRVDLLEKICKAAKATGQAKPVLEFYQPRDRDSAVRIEIPGKRRVLAVIMPCRSDWEGVDNGKADNE